MAIRELNFSYFEEQSFGHLNPEDVKLFYYDICLEYEKEDFAYYWDEEIISFLEQNKVIIKTIKEKDIPESISSNTIYFTMCSRDRRNKAAGFCRHLRNSFAHFLITYNGENLSIKDKRYDKKRNEWKTTMIGNIKRKDFNTLFQIFFKQKAQSENEYQKFINK